MDMSRELKDDKEAEAVALLSSAYTLLAFAPLDTWNHQGTPAQMAAYVVKDLKNQGRLGFLFESLGLYRRNA